MDRFASLLLLGALVQPLAVSAGPLEELLPVPKRVVPGKGIVPASALRTPTVVRGAVAGAPELTADEAYRLEISPDGVKITSSGARGERHARTTLEQLRLLSGDRVRCCTIEDWPVMRWRGFMHDCGRNYLDLDSIRKTLDLMAAYKFNLFHWHLTDYYGWRLESKRYPMLQAAWAFRRHAGKYYTQEDFKAIVAYAKSRGITVMPELDVPGHTLAFRRGLNLERMADPRVKGIVGDLIDELCALVPAEDMPYVHLGTDEARTQWEQVPDSFCPAWAGRVFANGRTPVGWVPGKSMTQPDGRKSVAMVWHEGEQVAPDQPCFDTVRCYFGSLDPFSFLNRAVFSKPLRYAVPATGKLGVVICSWHDDFVGDDYSRVLRNNNFALAAAMFCDQQWSERQSDRPQYLFRLPKPGTDEFAEAVAFENRIVAHRDTVLARLGLPVSYVRQTPLRWRVSTEDGRLLATDYAGAHVVIALGVGHGIDVRHSLLPELTGTAVLETWIESPRDQDVGAFIALVDFGRSGGRNKGLPEQGEWNRGKGSRVELNGERIPPPQWEHPGLVYQMEHPEEPTSNNVAETPVANESYFMRPPTPIRLRAGWNHVRLTVGKERKAWDYSWTALFVPVTLERTPREVPGLVYRAHPPAVP